MKKVKIFARDQYDELENAINDFIKDKNVLDIKYVDLVDSYVSALILYEELPTLDERIDTHMSLFDQIYNK